MDIQENVALGRYTTLKIGGPARFFAAVRGESDLKEGLAFAETAKLPVFLLGGGSNLLVADRGFAGLVLQVTPPASIERHDDGDQIHLDVSAGTEWDELVRTACEENLFGMECLAGIPGMTGGAPIQNIGAYGQEVSQTISRIVAYDRAAKALVELRAEDCQFAYRESVFNGAAKERYVVLQVRFTFKARASANLEYRDLAALRGTHPSAFDVYQFVRKTRDAKGMLIDPQQSLADARSAGSFFRNPVVAQAVFAKVVDQSGLDKTDVPHWAAGVEQVKLSAAWLIEKAGFAKGFRLGPVGVSTRHTLALTNVSGEATCADLLTLRDLIVTTVAAKYGVTLVQEPVMLG